MPSNLLTRALCISCLIGSFLLLTSVAQHAKSTNQKLFASANDLSFSITCDRKSYKVGQQIEFTYRIKNVGKSAIFVPSRVWDIKCMTPPHVWARLIDSSGTVFEPGYAGSCLGPESFDVRDTMRKDAVLLRPGQTLEKSSTFETNVFEDKPKPGMYRLEATLCGWKQDLFAESERSLLLEFGHPFVSGEVRAATTVELTF